MKTFLKSIIILIVAIIVIVIGGAYLIPEEAVVERTATMAAPPDKVFAIVSNVKRFNEWSPWTDLDATTKYAFEGPDSGVGQKMSWTSTNPDVGNGSLTYTEVVPNEKVLVELYFGDMGKSLSTITLMPSNGGTAVVWNFRTKVNGIMERWLSLMFDKWIGADYVKGLTRLRALAEKENTGG